MHAITKNNLLEQYSKGTIIIHWISFLLIIILIPTGFIMGEMEAGNAKHNLLLLHVMAGILVFVLTILRAWLFFRCGRPTKLETGHKLHNKLVVWVERSFYYLLILLCLSGIILFSTGNIGKELLCANSFALTSPVIKIGAQNVHKISAIIMIVLLLSHIAGVANHYVRNKENILKRILP